MRLIDADKLMPINAPIAGITSGELTHYEKIVFWKTIYDAPTINVIDRVLETLDKEIDLYRQLGKPDNQHRDVISALVNFRKLIVKLKEGEQE